MIFEGTKNQFFFGLGLTRAGESFPDIGVLESLSHLLELPTEDNSAGKFETQLENIINMESFDREKIQKVIKKVIINGEDNIEIVWNTDDLFFK